MSPTEVSYRLQDVARRRAWAKRQVRDAQTVGLPAGVAKVRTFSAVLPPDSRFEVPADAGAAVVLAADRVLAGTWTVLGVNRADSADPDWFADPVTGRRAPATTLAFRVQHRDENLTGNVKQIWEMSRHHHLTVLASAWWLTGEEKYATGVADQLQSWWRANPFLSGVHWTSSIEVAVRLLSWVWIRRLLDGWPKVAGLFENNEDAVRQIAWHAEFLAAFPSRGSSANNHALAEAAGQLAVACAFPWYEQTPRWRRDAADILEREVAANTFPSGVNRELASDYHRFVLELMLVAGVEAAVAGHPLSKGFRQCLARMLDAAEASLDTAGRPPRQGDGDEGRGLLVDHPDRDPWGVALGAAAAVVGRPRWSVLGPNSVLASLLGVLARPHCMGTGLDRSSERPRLFADAGLTLLRSREVDGAEIWCRCDSGPHGFLSIAAHAHADALSVEVRHDGVEILVDPGTYCYHGEADWRQYFRSTIAHNTLEIDRRDQAQSGGPFLWTAHPRSSTLRCTVGDLPLQSWTAQHDGYRRLSCPATHRRCVSLDSRERTVTAVDTVAVAGSVAVRLAWHLGPTVSVEIHGNAARLSWPVGPDVRHGRLHLPEGLEWTAHRGEAEPIVGWYSPRFATLVPTTSLIGAGSMASTTCIVTTLELP